MSRRRRAPERKRWIPMQRGVLSPTYREAAYPGGLPEGVERIEVWGNDTYEAAVEHRVDGWAYITLKRYDRRAVRDWRHLQSIKNEVVGPEREGFEIFPRESALMDEANQYHLWVLPPGEMLLMTEPERRVGDTSFTQGRVRGQHRGRQRPWQPGLSTGPEVGSGRLTDAGYEHPEFYDTPGSAYANPADCPYCAPDEPCALHLGATG